VAIEYGWDRDTFLSQTSMKAGMKADDWKEGADIYVFSADVFTEK
jgi:AMMECR1 domain-containing protein